ncbi:type II secretion system protein N [Rhodoferax sp.]|uniref:type II secretion system protein N n=1 Tax=Rhodoferax sp. TaxID=50421 RepID=UPI00274855CD|nr:type II secretion system protein N [Rhodoferax sp.]
MATFLLWVAASASLAFWGLKWSTAGVKLPGASVAGSGGPAPTDPRALARLLGAEGALTPVMAAPDAASRYTLMGVVAGVHGAGVALISVDGKAARPFEVGAVIEAPLVLKSVASRQAILAGGIDAPATVTLELPPVKHLPASAKPEPMPMPMPMPPVKANPLEGNPFKPSLGM